MSKILDFLKNKRKRILLLFLDAMAAGVCFGFSWITIVGKRIDSSALLYAFQNVVFIAFFLAILGVYRRIWRYAQMRDYLLVALGVLMGGLFCFLADRLSGCPKQVQYIVNNNTEAAKLYYAFMAFSLVAGMFALIVMRMVYRVIYDKSKTAPVLSGTKARRRTLIVGAGQACCILLSEIRHTDCEYDAVGIIDDDMTKTGRNIDGVPIFGPIDKVGETAEKLAAAVIIIAIPSAGKEDGRRIVRLCNETGCEVRIIPEIHNIVDSRRLISQMRKIDMADLLGREPIVIDTCESSKLIGGKTVMVTGGGGSIGSELCRQIMLYSPKLLIIADIYENNAYDIQQELWELYGRGANIEVHIASVRDYDKMRVLFESRRPELVFHAAAHKHVPLMECDPEEAVKNNICGTYNTAVLAHIYGAKRFVLISTDKAVNPTSVMGATKRFCEMLIQHFDASYENTEYCAVRFGNVLGSNGSVIPLFIKLIEQRKDLPVTHPDITRYFMTVSEAVSLVLRAGAMACGGEIFVLDMGEPVRITDLARNLIRLHGYVPDKDIKIKYVGLRPGEKLYEETLLGGSLKSTYHDKIFIEETGKPDGKKLLEYYALMRDRAENNDGEGVVELLKEAVPAFKEERETRVKTTV